MTGFPLPALILRSDQSAAPDLGEVEIVERKGLGHPDTICDALAEEICRALCRAYVAEFGEVLHHNVDKILLCGGVAHPSFRGGEILEPIELYLGGRATSEMGGRRIPVAEIARDACRRWLRERLPVLDLDRDVSIVPKFRTGSGSLRALFSRGRSVALANDTSCGAGFAPFTELERVVLEVEKTLNSAGTKTAHPAIGSDIKVMGVRRSSRIHLTIACAMIGKHLASSADYLRAKAEARELVLASARRVTAMDLECVVNAADDIERGEIYLTVTGTSAEAGDDGETGRGNRVSGLITPYRPMTLEAAAGKNPVSHVGKLYNLAATRICNQLVSRVPGILGASCVIVSQIGRPVDDPQVVDLRLRLPPGESLERFAAHVERIAAEELSRFAELRAELLAGRIIVY